MKSHIRLIIACILLVGGNHAYSTVLYKYESFHYTSVISPYSTSMNFFGHVRLDDALQPNSTYADISSLVESFHFFDGLRQYDQSNSIGVFFMSTDATGLPDRWKFEMANPRFQNDLGWSEGEQAWRLVFDDSGGVTRTTCTTVNPDTSCGFAFNQPFASTSIEGTWKVSVVPSPSSLTILVSPLLLLATLKLRKQ